MILIFDGDCKFCSSSARLFTRITKNRIPTKPFQKANLTELGLRLEDCKAALQYVSKEQVSAGHLAVANALIDSKTSWAVIGHLMKWPIITSVGYVVYYWIAKNRHRLPGGTPACALDQN